jgi:hypothetical protein
MSIMAGILEHLLQPQKKAIFDLSAMELETSQSDPGGGLRDQALGSG